MQGWVGRCGAQCSLQPGAGCEQPRALPPQHQQQVLQAVERAKQVTMGELNSIVGVSGTAWLWAKILSFQWVQALQ